MPHTGLLEAAKQKVADLHLSDGAADIAFCLLRLVSVLAGQWSGQSLGEARAVIRRALRSTGSDVVPQQELPLPTLHTDAPTA